MSIGRLGREFILGKFVKTLSPQSRASFRLSTKENMEDIDDEYKFYEGIVCTAILQRFKSLQNQSRLVPGRLFLEAPIFTTNLIREIIHHNIYFLRRYFPKVPTTFTRLQESVLQHICFKHANIIRVEFPFFYERIIPDLASVFILFSNKEHEQIQLNIMHKTLKNDEFYNVPNDLPPTGKARLRANVIYYDVDFRYIHFDTQEYNYLTNMIPTLEVKQVKSTQSLHQSRMRRNDAVPPRFSLFAKYVRKVEKIFKKGSFAYDTSLAHGFSLDQPSSARRKTAWEVNN